ncbi:unnamed protein product [Linum tenue]|uniref:NADP-dependent oxidoreductase domain-containing protein n=1 Tax=Linum tenue TaxID=586396 RepID=A0AAV0P3Q0_9ROSI|nr:unnamed protein product [Linum tenue]
MENPQQTQIPKVKLGNQGLEVSRLGFGCASLAGTKSAPLSHEEACSLIAHAVKRGITFIDTSDLYGNDHESEIMVGKALKQFPREEIQLATKFGLYITEAGEYRVDGRPEYVRKCCEASLARLGVDCIDLYYQHRVDQSVPIEDTMEELKKLVNEGKIKYIGLSEPSPGTIRRAHASNRELGIGLVAYSPLGVGFFAGKAVVETFPDDRQHVYHPRFAAENVHKNKVLYTRVANLATKHGCTPPQLALAWLLHQGNDIIPLPGTKSPCQNSPPLLIVLNFDSPSTTNSQFLDLPLRDVFAAFNFFIALTQAGFTRN